MHVILSMIVIFGVGYLSLKYKAKMILVKARTRPLNIVCVYGVYGMIGLYFEFVLLVVPLKDFHKICKKIIITN